MGIDSRISRLENEGSGKPCEECGGPPKPGAGVLEHETYFTDPALGPVWEGPEHCPACGRQLIITISFPSEKKE